MIQKVEMYQAVCDGCGKLFRLDFKNIGIFNTRNEAQIIVGIFNWLIDSDKCYCPDCVEYDPETKNYKPKNKKQ